MRIFSLLLCLAVATSCSTSKKAATDVKKNQAQPITSGPLVETIAEVKKAFAPDKRVALFAMEPLQKSNQVWLKGETNLPDAKRALVEKLQAQNISFIDSVQVLPAADLGDKTFGIITLSVASIRSEPKEWAELATQATLGTPVKVFKRQGFWLLVQTPDGYISWADVGAVWRVNQGEYTAWQQAPKLIYLTPNGYSYAEPLAESQVVSDLVGGSVLRLVAEKDKYYQVAYPDGREAYVLKTEAKPYAQWLSSLQVTEQSLVSTAKKMMGLPYLWGGTSFKAVDCSGFTKTIYFMNGMIIPRDASQQVHTGELIDVSQGFNDLHPGDLLFFGKAATDSTSERVSHVAMWIGNNEFIHASSQVRVSSVDKNAKNYDEFNLNRLLRVKRILHTQSKEIVQLNSVKVY